MKFIIILSLSAILGTFAQLSQAVNCPNINYNLNSQTEVDAFPGSCDTIAGQLIIRETDPGDPITNLNALSAITSVGRYLQLRNTTVLTDTAGLGNLASLGRYLLIRDNAALTNLNGFASLTTLGSSSVSYLRLQNNNSLADISGLLGLNAIAGNLYIRDNNILPNIDGLAGIASVGGYTFIRNNDLLIDVDGLSTLTTIGRFLRIQDNNILGNIGGLSSLSSVGSYVLIRNNDLLTTLNGLDNLSTIGSYLQIRDNNILADINALGGLSDVPGYLQIRNNDLLTTLNGLGNLSTIGGYLQIRDNNILADISALVGISDVPGYLLIRNNDLLTTLTGLETITSIGDYLQIQDNNILADINALASIITVPGYLTIRNNDVLPNLDGLAQLIGVNGNVQVRLNNILNACTALIPLLDAIDDDIPGPGIAPTPDVGGTINISTNGNTSCNSQAGILAAVVPPGFSQVFTPDVISISATITDSSLEFTIDNSGSIVKATELAFSNTLPAGIAIAATPNAAVTCTDGTLTAAGGTASITYTGGTVAAASSCSVKLDVVGLTEGNHPNTTGDLTFTLGNSGNSTASITVDDTPPVITIPGDNPLSLFVGDSFVDPAVTATDTIDGAVAVTPSGTVDTGVPGMYTRTFSAQDGVGNTDSVDLVVDVVVPPIPAISLTPAGIDFGIVVVGDTSGTETVTIVSIGTAPLNVSAIDLATAPFALVGGSCATPPFTLAIGEDCTVQYTFTPAINGPVTTQLLNVTSDATTSPTPLTLDGEGLLPVRSFTAPLPSGNTGTLSFTTTDATCSFEGTPTFLPASGLSPAPPDSVVLIDGVAQFVISGCAVGATVDLTLDYGAALPSGARYVKQASPWREIASTLSGSTAKFSLTDGGTNDDDGMADGRIVDPSGAAMPPVSPVPPAPEVVPTLPQWMLALLCLMTGWFGLSRVSRKQ